MTKPGLPKKYAKMGFKKGWRKYKKALKKRKKSTSSRSTSGQKSGNRNSQSGRSGRVGNNSFNYSKIYGILRKAALVLPAGAIAMTTVSNYEKLVAGVQAYFGYNLKTRDFKLERLRQGWEPYFWANVVTKGIPAAIKFIKGFFG